MIFRLALFLTTILFAAGCGGSDEVTQPDPGNGGDDTTATGNATLALAFAFVGSDGTVSPGETAVSRATVVNESDARAEHVRITLLVRDDFERVSASFDSGATKITAIDTMLSATFSLDAGDTAWFEVTERVPAFYPDETPLIGAAWFEYDHDRADSSAPIRDTVVAIDTISTAGATFRLFAPGVQKVHLSGAFNNWTMDGDYAMYRSYLNSDSFAITVPASAGDQYKFVLEDTVVHRTEWIADPYARNLAPDGFGGFNSVYGATLPDPVATLAGGVDPARLVIYEMLVDDFSAGRDFESVTDGITGAAQNLADLGVNAIELLPVTGVELDGAFNWGYEPHHFFCPNPNYGTPEDFANLVETAHANGMAVLLDMVFNHVGRRAPIEQIDRLGTFGTYINWDQPVVFGMNQTNWGSSAFLDFAVESALFWIEQYGIDGFRMDFVDANDYTGWRYLVDRVREKHPDVFIIGEDFNYPPFSAVNQTGMDAQWGGQDTDQWGNNANNFMHNVMALLKEAPYAGRAWFPGRGSFDTEDNPMWSLASVVSWNMEFPSHTSAIKYIVRHDERHIVDEVDTRGTPEAQAIGGLQKAKLGAATLFTSTGVPMFYMGEEIGEDDFVPNLPAPNPVDWGAGSADLRAYYRKLIALRLTHPALATGGVDFHCPNWDQDQGPCQQDKTICYWRYEGSDPLDAEIVVVSNFDHEDHDFAIPFPSEGEWRRIGPDGEETVTLQGATVLEETLPAAVSYIFVKE
ncbi:MAG: hypothetical protein HKN20_11480 [Gemmatimonadetes bacterium]|nr:hypothetical protein [Gemmatimonadota bacterium]